MGVLRPGSTRVGATCPLCGLVLEVGQDATPVESGRAAAGWGTLLRWGHTWCDRHAAIT